MDLYAFSCARASKANQQICNLYMYVCTFVYIYIYKYKYIYISLKAPIWSYIQWSSYMGTTESNHNIINNNLNRICNYVETISRPPCNQFWSIFPYSNCRGTIDFIGEITKQNHPPCVVNIVQLRWRYGDETVRHKVQRCVHEVGIISHNKYCD